MRVIHKKILLLVLLCACASGNIVAQKITKETIVSQGKKRSYYLYVPKGLTPSKPVPLIVLLHGSGHVGLSLAEKWDGLAKKEGVIIIAPDSADSSHWSAPGDGPAFLHELVEAVKTKYPINAKRVYLFGHSAGANFALLMSLYESEYFAATAIHAGALDEESLVLLDQAKRKTPIQIQVGTVDQFFPLTAVRNTRDQMNARGFSVQLVEIPGHDHWYYDLAPKINQTAWEFLRGFELPGEPQYEEKHFQSEGQQPPREAIEQYTLGMKRQAAGDLAGAVAAYTRAIEIHPKFAEAFNNRGVAYLNQKNYAAADADFTRSLELEPSDAAYNNRGSIYLSQHKTEEAISDFTAAIRMKASEEGYANRGVAYQQTHRDALALADYEAALNLNPKFGRAYVLRGLILLKSGQDSAAQKDFDYGFQLDPNLHAEFDPMIKQLRANH